jgi:type IV pilus assembly protein PilX
MNMKSRHQQRGAVLIVSLLILLVLTVVGVAGLTNTSLEERMSHNFQHGMLVFQGSESANEAIIQSGNPGGAGDFANPYYVEADDPLLTALDAGIDDTSTVVAQDMDPDGLLGGATLATSSIVSYAGSLGDLCAGEGSAKCYRFQLTTTATIAETGTTTTHIKGVERVSPNPG